MDNLAGVMTMKCYRLSRLREVSRSFTGQYVIIANGRVLVCECNKCMSAMKNASAEAMTLADYNRG